MRILVTGATGFIGAHSVAALVRGGHDVRLLVRDPARVGPALRPVGVDPGSLECVRGDVTDPDSVARAVAGCAGVLHAAGVYSFDTRDHARMRRTNARGTEVVLAAARTAGCDPVVCVSTFGVLAPDRDRPVTAASAVAAPRETYLATKVAAEHVARRYQAEGAPVVITYPLATLGPHDPHRGDQTARLRNTLRGLMPVWPTGGFPVGDVRDVAELHAALMRPGTGGTRYLAPGGYVDTAGYVAALRRVTGRGLPALRLPARAMLPLGRLVSAAQRIVPVHIPAEYGAIYTCAVSRPVDTTATTALLGGPGRTLDETMADTVRWLRDAGLVGARQAGHAIAQSRRNTPADF